MISLKYWFRYNIALPYSVLYGRAYDAFFQTTFFANDVDKVHLFEAFAIGNDDVIDDHRAKVEPVSVGGNLIIF